MKNMLLTGAMLTLAVAAIAGPPKEKKGATPTTIKCAVMSQRDVNVKEATDKKMFADYKGNRYFFCCGGCPSEFAKNKDKFAKTAAHIPIPKGAKKS